MKFTNIIALLILFICTKPLFAQQLTEKKDTTAVVVLDEVQIQCYCDANSRNNKTRRKDGQARTERLIDGIAGAGIISRGNFAQEPIIRGLSDGQIHVNINGMKIFGACTDRMDPATSYIEPNNLQSIKLNNGPGFDAGGATIGGGFNFTLKEPQLNAEKTLETSIGAGFESNALARQFLGNLQYSTKKFAINVNGIYRKADNYTPGGNINDLIKKYGLWTKETGFSVDDKARVLFSQYEKWNAGFAAKYQVNEKHFLNADYIIDKGKNIGYPSLTMDVAFANANIVSFSHQYVNQNAKLSSVETKAYFNHIDHAMDDTKRPSVQVPMHMDMPGYSWTAGVFSKVAFNFRHQRLQAKVERYVNRWHAEMTMYANSGNFSMYMLTIPDAQRGVTGLDIEDNIHINDHVRLLAGGRIELNTSSIFTPEGVEQLSVIYTNNLARNNFLWNAYLQGTFNITPQLQFVAKGAKALRAATLKELYSVYLLNRVDNYEYIGSPAIKNESAINLDASLVYKSNPVYVSLKGFGYFFQNYIAGSVIPGAKATMGATGVKRYVNIFSAKLYGGELTIMLQPLSQLSFSSMNTYQQGIDADKNSLPMISPFHSINKIEWTPAGDWNVFAESVYAAKQNKASSFYGESATPAFNVLNAGVVKTFYTKNSRIVVSLTALNVLNQYYYEHLDVIKLPRPGRNIVAHATIYF